jgi:hypothetical protein
MASKVKRMGSKRLSSPAAAREWRPLIYSIHIHKFALQYKVL